MAASVRVRGGHLMVVLRIYAVKIPLNHRIGHIATHWGRIEIVRCQLVDRRMRGGRCAVEVLSVLRQVIGRYVIHDE